MIIHLYNVSNIQIEPENRVILATTFYLNHTKCFYLSFIDLEMFMYCSMIYINICKEILKNVVFGVALHIKKIL